VEEGKAPASAPASKYLSKGLTRSRTDKLVVMQGRSDNAGAQQAASASPQPSNVTAFAGGVQGAVALKGELEAKLSPAQALENLPWQAPVSNAKAAAAEKRAEARAKGYEGDACGECQNYTLVRNGTCMKCDTCGSTTGCS
jgi:ribonucleoside-diphosphate reductase alpha chain